MKMRYKILLLLLFSLGVHKSMAQFSYAGLRLSYYNVRFDAGDGFDFATRINDLAVNVDFIHRPIRNIGVGVSVRVPVIHGFKYVFEGADQFGGPIQGSGDIEDQNVSFGDGEIGYFIKNTFSITLIGRFFFSTDSDLYLDLRYTLEMYNEEFRYNQFPLSNLIQEDINFDENTMVRGIGFTLGYSPEIADNLFINYAFTVDFLGTSRTSFEYFIAEDEFNGSINFRRFTSKIDDTQTAYELSMGLMYRF